MNFGLESELIIKLKSIFRQFPEIEKVVIFGSRAKGNYKVGSDIDLAIIGDFSSNVLSKIYNQIDELNTPYKFDLINYNSITNNDLLDHINRVGKIIYTNKKEIII